MPRKKARDESLDLDAARHKLDLLWREVCAAAEATQDFDYVDDSQLRLNIKSSINHSQVGYRYCLVVQLLGKHVNPTLRTLALQRGTASTVAGTWDARSFASKVVSPFSLAQEAVLGTSNDPYVGNAFRVPSMVRDDKSKKDIAGWNVLIDVLQNVQSRGDRVFTLEVLKQVLLEIFRRQRHLRFSYPVPLRVSLERTLGLSKEFLSVRSGGDRALALAGALFDLIGERFGLYERVNRARINASDQATGQAADLECTDKEGRVLLAVEVKDRALTLADVEGTIAKTRHRMIAEILFAVPQTVVGDEPAIQQRVESAFATGQSIYRSDFFDLAKAIFTLTGDGGRVAFLRRVGEHLNEWNTQPSHRTAWKKLLENL